jgi:hypothetical protein
MDVSGHLAVVASTESYSRPKDAEVRNVRVKFLDEQNAPYSPPNPSGEFWIAADFVTLDILEQGDIDEAVASIMKEMT